MYTIFFSQSSFPLVGYTFQCKVLCISSLVCLSGGEVGDNLLCCHLLILIIAVFNGMEILPSSLFYIFLLVIL